MNARTLGATGATRAIKWTTGVLADGFWTHPLTRSTASVLFLLFVSATWIETDAYRFAGVLLAASGVIAYLKGDFRPSIGWMGALCLIWGVWISARYVLAVNFAGLHGHGSSEGIYLLPLLYPVLGFTMYIHRTEWRDSSVLFIATSLLAALATVDLVGSFDGDFHDIFDTNNRIHGSIGAGFVILAALTVMGYEGRTEPDPRLRWAMEILCLITITICAIGLYGAKSKGVWAALVIALALQGAFAARAMRGRQSARMTGLAVTSAAIAAVAVFHRPLWDTVSPSLGGLVSLFLRATTSSDPVALFRETVACGSGLPRGTYLRLMMWHDALEVWSHAVIFGNGIAWQDLYHRSFYAGTGFEVVHNGYLEIAMRYGLVGIGFTLLVFGWSISMARRACRLGLIAPEALRFHACAAVYFLATMATNANNRLSIGESYMTAVGAFGFCCLFLIAAERARAADGRAGDTPPAVH